MYLAFDIGCIECGEDSAVIGVFKTRDEADKAAIEYVTSDGLGWGRPEWGGQHRQEVFEIEVPE